MDSFKDALTQYYKGGQTEPERQETLGSYDKLKETADKHLSPPPQKELSLAENTNKSKKDLDKLIQEVILNKNK